GCIHWPNFPRMRMAGAVVLRVPSLKGETQPQKAEPPPPSKRLALLERIPADTLVRRLVRQEIELGAEDAEIAINKSLAKNPAAWAQAVAAVAERRSGGTTMGRTPISYQDLVFGEGEVM